MEWLIEFCARLYLEQRWDRQLRNFVNEFQKLELQDEKTEFVEKFLSTLHSTMLRDPMWQSKYCLFFDHKSVIFVYFNDSKRMLFLLMQARRKIN